MSTAVLIWPWYKMRERYCKHAGTYLFILVSYSLLSLLFAFIPVIGAYTLFMTLISLAVSVPLVLMRDTGRSKIAPVFFTLVLLVALVFNVMKINDIGWANYWNSLVTLSALSK